MKIVWLLKVGSFLTVSTITTAVLGYHDFTPDTMKQPYHGSQPAAPLAARPGIFLFLQIC